MDGTCCISSDGGWKWVDVLHDLGMRMSDLAHQDYLVKAESLQDIRDAHAPGPAWPSSSASRPPR